MDNIILVGGGGHAHSCIDIIESENKFKIAGIIDNSKERDASVLGYPVVGTDQDLIPLRKSYQFALVTVGQISHASTRKNLYESLKSCDYQLPVITSPFSVVSKHSHVDDGSIIMHNTIINSNAVVGVNCIINSRALIEHDVEIASHCHISTGAIVNGEAIIGKESFVGSNAVITQGVKIGRNCVIGAGCVIKEDVPDNQLIK